MTPETAAEIAAYVGAAAWLPQIIGWVYNYFTKPRVLLLNDGNAELGFTTFGPIFNLRLAFSASKKDAIIDDLKVVLTHENGDKHIFRWIGYTETFSEIRDFAGNRQRVEKDQVAIAIKISTANLLEKFVRFNDLAFQDEIKDVWRLGQEHLEYLKTADPEKFREIALKSKQYSDILAIHKKHLWWQEGKYTFRFLASSLNDAVIENQSFQFVLTKADVEALQQNNELLPKVYQNTVNIGLVGYKDEPIPWNWRTVQVSKC